MKCMCTAVGQLYEIASLPYDWNGNNADSFSSSHIKKCREILAKLPFKPEIYPTANGSIQMETCK